MSVSWAVRSVRAAMFTAVCVTLAAAGHTIASGSPPPVAAYGAGAAAVFAVSWLLGSRERTLAGITGALLATQAGLHLVWTTAQDRGAHTATAGASMAHPHMTHALTAHGSAAHAVAAVVASWWLRRGEAALWSLLRLATRLAPGLSAWWRTLHGPVVTPRRAGTAHRQTAPRQLPRTLLLQHALSRRGPPLSGPSRILAF